MSKEIAEDYASSLSDLTVNSKPLINMLTILAEENVEHAGVIVETVEKHLEKVQPEIKLPVLYLVDSIIKNVGGAYSTKFSERIVNMFTKTFKQVDEKTRSQMFKLRETWHDVFPTSKLYQLDVKVNLIDPAWPIQAQPQPHQANIHVNPNFLKKPMATTSAAPPLTKDEEMRAILAKKEQELYLLQRKKVEMELEQTRRQFAELAEKNAIIPPPAPMAGAFPVAMPVAMVNPVVAPPVTETTSLPVKQRLGPPVHARSCGRIAPISAPLLAARRDPRLARLHPPPPAAPPPPTILANDFDIKPLDRPKRKNFVTIDVYPVPPKRRDPRLQKKDKRKKEDERKKEPPKDKKEEKNEKIDADEFDIKSSKTKVDDYINRVASDSKKISKLPPIPKKKSSEEPKKDEMVPSPKKRKETSRSDKKKKRDSNSSDTSPEKKNKIKEKDKDSRKKQKEQTMEVDNEKPTEEAVPFKELKNYHKERYMRRNKEKSESPEKIPVKPVATLDTEIDSSNVAEAIVENKDVDLRVLHPIVAEVKPALIAQKRSSTDADVIESKSKKSKMDKFDILFGNEDVDLRQLPQVEETNGPAVVSNNTDSPKTETVSMEVESTVIPTPQQSPKEKGWNEVKEKTPSDGGKGLSKLDLVRAKLAEATKGKDRLGRPLRFTKSPSIEKERRRTLSSEDPDLRPESEDEVNKETINLILNQAKEHFNDGKMDKNQYNTLMFQVMQLNEKLKLKEAKLRESLEMSKRKLHKTKISDDDESTEQNKFGDIDERVTPAYVDSVPNSHDVGLQDFDMRVGPAEPEGPPRPRFPMPPMFMGPGPGQVPFQSGPMWRGMRPRDDFSGPRRMRGPAPPFFRNKFERGPRPFEPFAMSMPMPPKMGMCQGDTPISPYLRSESPPLLGHPGITIPPTDYSVIDYVDQDPMKTIEIDGVPREIRFYGETAVIMLDWDDPREIKFLPGARRITFDNKDSVVLDFNDDYRKIEIDDQVINIRFGAPTRELYINGRWYECFFGAPPAAFLIDGKPRILQLDGPAPKVDIGKVKRTDLVAGKINMIVDGQIMCPVFLDSKLQKFQIHNHFYSIRFVDSLKTVLINEIPFKVEFGGLPRPLTIDKTRHFIRFSVLPKNIKPGQIKITNMEGKIPEVLTAAVPPEKVDNANATVTEQDDIARPAKITSPDNDSNGGLDMLASVMPSSMAPASSFSGYTLAEPLFSTPPSGIPGLETQAEESKPAVAIPNINLNVNDLFAKLVASGIVNVPEKKEEVVDKEEVKSKPIEEKNVIHAVDLLKPETLRRKQSGIVSRLYGGMQCSGCGARFPPEHTTRYSQHLDWHFRQNRRERDSARRAHSRHWHYDLADWLQYEELEDLDEREKSWFETSAAAPEAESATAAAAGTAATPAPSVAAGAPLDRHCALCGDLFQQFYNEDQEEWHLRNSVRYEDNTYHPLCLEDHKASLAKQEEESKEEPVPEEEVAKSSEDAIEIKDADGDSQLDDDDVVEVVEDKTQEPLEIVEDECSSGEEDDVIYAAAPVELVTVRDDSGDETDEETRQQRHLRDVTHVRVKIEPVDPDDEPIITAEQEAIRAIPDTTSSVVQSSIDGNVELESTAPIAPVIPAGGIRINISKAIPAFVATTQIEDDKMLEDIGTDEPLPPGEEPELEYKLKPHLENVQFRRQPPVQRGSELSGLCSIM